MKLLLIALLGLVILAAAGCGARETSASPLPQAAPVAVTGEVTAQGRADVSAVRLELSRVSDEVAAEVVTEGLETPWEFAFLPDGRILLTERAGRVRLVKGGELLPEAAATINVAAVSESGLLGLALRPGFAANGHFYVCHSYRNPENVIRNRIIRLTLRGDTAGEAVTILDDMPGAANHNGCRLAFAPDGKLYATMGDAQNSALGQELNSVGGKVLRLEPDGAFPADNPFPNSPVFSYGHRNPQGLVWHTPTSRFYSTEHGPDVNDEINILRAGGNFGWPQSGVLNDPRYVDPILAFTPTIAPAGAAFYTGDTLAASWDGALVFATLKDSSLRRVQLTPDYNAVAQQDIFFKGVYGRLRAVVMGPDGYLYFSTSNRDGRGAAKPGDDKLLRLVPAAVTALPAANPDPAGRFELALPPGTYRARWSLPGFAAQEGRLVVAAAGAAWEPVALRAGDLNGDGQIDRADAGPLAEDFGATRSTPADFNADGAVDALDLALLARNVE